MKKTAPMSLHQLKKVPAKPAQKSQKTTLFEPIVQLYPVENIQFLLFNGPDMISAHLRTGKYWEHFLIQILQHFLGRMQKPVFVDIGANLGSISIPIGKFIQPKQGKVISFEAQRGVFYQLCGNIFANNLVNTCTAYNIAIGHIESEIDIPILDLSHETNVGSLSLDAEIRQEQSLLSTTVDQFEKVSLKTIDSLNLPHASLIKIDVEGLELEVLQGAKNWIESSNYPPIFFEVWGDYMKNQISKREMLMDFVCNTLGYETILQGELCIAQHPSNKYVEITLAENNSLSMKFLK
ncbi:FkbM family methyltransferase [Acinetobacter gerneri]|uniref:FkbM family methyltransferase n=1 Tax=Acinetobacter gerneri TaxID=202952 RepID=UPI0028A844D4|nr:FkbM family methyltransferase [Acinetobacter gerneri]